MNWILIIAYVTMGALGGLLLLVSLAFVFHTLWLLCSGRRVMATVVGYRNEEEEFYHHTDVRGHFSGETTSVTFHVPVFTFVDDNGATHEAEGMGTMKKRFQKGDRVVLIYLPRNPKRCVVDDFINKWVPALTAFAIGAILSALPAWWLFGLSY